MRRHEAVCAIEPISDGRFSISVCPPAAALSSVSRATRVIA
jgi:hypothetical protein